MFLLLDLVEPLEKLRMGEVKFPKEEDFFGAIQAVIRLQDTYELNMKQLTRGNILGKQTKAGGYYYYLIFERAIIGCLKKHDFCQITWAFGYIMLNV